MIIIKSLTKKSHDKCRNKRNYFFLVLLGITRSAITKYSRGLNDSSIKCPPIPLSHSPRQQPKRWMEIARFYTPPGPPWWLTSGSLCAGQVVVFNDRPNERSRTTWKGGVARRIPLSQSISCFVLIHLKIYGNRSTPPYYYNLQLGQGRQLRILFIFQGNTGITI